MNKVFMCSVALLCSSVVSANEIDVNAQVKTQDVTVHTGYMSVLKSQNHAVITNNTDDKRNFKVLASFCVGGFGCEDKKYDVSVNSHASYDSGDFQLSRKVQPYQSGKYPIEAMLIISENDQVLRKEISRSTMRGVY